MRALEWVLGTQTQNGDLYIISNLQDKMWVLVTQLCPILCKPMDCSLPGSSALGILQVRILEWLVSSGSRDQTQCCFMVGRLFTSEPPGKTLTKEPWIQNVNPFPTGISKEIWLAYTTKILKSVSAFKTSGTVNFTCVREAYSSYQCCSIYAFLWSARVTTFWNKSALRNSKIRLQK